MITAGDIIIEIADSEMDVKEKSSSFLRYRLRRTKSKYDGTKMIVWDELTADLRSIGIVFGFRKLSAGTLKYS